MFLSLTIEKIGVKLTLKKVKRIIKNEGHFSIKEFD
jgi:hypothetical protein